MKGNRVCFTCGSTAEDSCLLQFGLVTKHVSGEDDIELEEIIETWSLEDTD